MQPKPSIVNDDKGSIIVAALMVLVLLTIIGISASNTSVNEVQIATNSLLYERAFYTAESGLVHAKPLDMETIIQNASPYISRDLPGEAVLTIGASLAEVVSHTCGVIAIGPFGCMPNRL